MHDDEWYGDLDEKKAKELAHSRRLDVHRWSDHKEANEFINLVYKQFFTGGYQKVQIRNLKVVLLDLYVAWTEDPELKIAFSRNANDYYVGTIYNELNISRRTIGIVDRLVEVGLVDLAKGFMDRKTGIGRLSRMWPTDKLISMFQHAKFSAFDIGNSPDRLPIELRDLNGERVEYERDEFVSEQVELLNRYNELLANTHVSLPYAKGSSFRVSADSGDGSGLFRVTQTDKFVYRVFNHKSFDLGGRFFGGWWQRCPSAMRKDILLDDHATVEIDYSSLHPTLLYAYEGINYWGEISSDPYAIGKLSFEGDEEKSRELAKSVMLILLNIDEEEKLPAAFRKNAKPGSAQKKYKNEQVFEILERISELHHPISGYFCSGIGLSLQNTDASITEIILRYFVDRDWPILLIHDSYVVPDGLHEKLELAMESAFREVCGDGFQSLSKFVDLTRQQVMDELYSRYTHAAARMTEEEQAEDLAFYLTADPEKSKYHKRDWEMFQRWKETRLDTTTSTTMA